MELCSYCHRQGHHYLDCNIGVHEAQQYIEATKMLFYLVNERWLVLTQVEQLAVLNAQDEPIWQYYHDLKTLQGWIQDDLMRRNIFFLQLLYHQLQNMTHYLPLRQNQNQNSTHLRNLDGIMEMFDSVKHMRPESLHNVLIPHAFLPLIASRESIYLEPRVQIQGSILSIVDTPVTSTVDNHNHIVVVESNNKELVPDDVCGICLSNDSFIQTQCGHPFCQCIQTHLLKYNKACPLCRTDITHLTLFDKRSYECMKTMNDLVPNSILSFPDSSQMTIS